MNKNTRLYLVTYRSQNNRDNMLLMNIRLLPDDEYINDSMKLVKEAKNILNELFNTENNIYDFYDIHPITLNNIELCYMHNAEPLKNIVYYSITLKQWLIKRYNEPNTNILNCIKDLHQNILIYGTESISLFNNGSIMSILANEIYYMNFIPTFRILASRSIDEMIQSINNSDKNIRTSIVVGDTISYKDLYTLYSSVNYRYDVDIFILDSVTNILHKVVIPSDKFEIIK